MNQHELPLSFPDAKMPPKYCKTRAITACREWLYEKQGRDLSAPCLDLVVQLKHFDLKNTEGNSGNSVPLCVTVSAHSCHKS